ncbi:MAG: NAD-dependent epimerase/dehydratase family protein [Planctomycetota bacterium]
MKALVTGGGGFLGRAIVDRLLARGDSVRSFSRGAYPELDALGVKTVRGDLGDGAAVREAAAGCDIVFHVAAKAGVWGPAGEYERANVLGTDHVLAACCAHGIQRLVYTSSPSVAFHGEDQEGTDESQDYPDSFLCHYPRTKAIAEKRVLEANGADLATVVLRPHLIWGPGDPHLVPRIVERARAGRLRLLGGGNKLVDSVFVDNAADAHLLAADRLAPESPIAGRTYYVTQGEPIPMRELIGRILKAAGLPPETRSVSAGVAYAAGAVLETLFRMVGAKNEPPMTRFVARQLSTAHWFDLAAARSDLGYDPAVSLDEGMERLATWLRGNPSG